MQVYVEGRPWADLDQILHTAFRQQKRILSVSANGKVAHQRIYLHSARQSAQRLADAAELLGADVSVPTLTVKPRLVDLARRVRELMYRDQWTVGAIPVSELATIMEGKWPDVCWFPEPEGRDFDADPMVFDNTVYYEKFDARRGLGEIWQRTLLSDFTGWMETSCILRLEEHLSYPFVYLNGSRPLLVPEQATLGATCAYHIDGSASNTLLTSALVDPTLLHHNGMWYLFGTKPGKEEMLSLYCYVSVDGLGNFTPHPANPVVITARGGRMGGPFFEYNGTLLRPGQDYSKRYGGAIVLFAVERCTPEEYTEREYGLLQASPRWRYNEGIHTFCVGKKIIAIDALRSRIAW